MESLNRLSEIAYIGMHLLRPGCASTPSGLYLEGETPRVLGALMHIKILLKNMLITFIPDFADISFIIKTYQLLLIRDFNGICQLDKRKGSRTETGIRPGVRCAPVPPREPGGPARRQHLVDTRGVAAFVCGEDRAAAGAAGKDAVAPV